MRKRKDNPESGFTLVEILVTVLIIGILASISVPVYLKYQRTAEITTLKSDISATAINVTAYTKTNNGAYPTGADFTSQIVSSKPANVITINQYTSGTTVEACIQGDRAFGSNDTVTWNYSLTTKQLKEGACTQTAVLAPENPS